MAGSSTSVMEKSDSQDSQNLFVWDDKSQLYFHASGFYHEPNAGWYYSTRDELYYKFENGNYVLLDSDQRDKSEMSETELGVQENSFRDEQGGKVANNGEIGSLVSGGNTECNNSFSPENHRPPSEWLEETLINLYLSGYSNQAIDVTRSEKTDEVDNVELQDNGDNGTDELEEGEWIPEDDYDGIELNEDMSDEGFFREEENWRAQYGQVIRSSEETTTDVLAVDLWDWSMVKGTRKHGKGEIMRLVGRPMRRSVKLHPSMPCGGGRLKTAPIREVHLDLVRVTTGQIYRLRNPSAKFLASIIAYDSSNPTKDWGFPELSLHEVKQSIPPPKLEGKTDVRSGGDLVATNAPTLQVVREKNKNNEYRDRAAERRALYGSFGVAPGQKNLNVDDDNDSPSISTDEAAAEALDMSFGAGSYARRLLEGMGWKQGEALGKTVKGLVEPIQAEGNIGSAGLGWPRGRMKPR